MSTISRQTIWSTGDTLTAAALNNEFNNIINDYNGSINENNLGTIKNLVLSNSTTTTVIDVTNTSTGAVLEINS